MTSICYCLIFKFGYSVWEELHSGEVEQLIKEECFREENRRQDKFDFYAGNRNHFCPLLTVSAEKLLLLYKNSCHKLK